MKGVSDKREDLCHCSSMSMWHSMPNLICPEGRAPPAFIDFYSGLHCPDRTLIDLKFNEDVKVLLECTNEYLLTIYFFNK